MSDPKFIHYDEESWKKMAKVINPELYPPLPSQPLFTNESIAKTLPQIGGEHRVLVQCQGNINAMNGRKNLGTYESMTQPPGVPSDSTVARANYAHRVDSIFPIYEERVANCDHVKGVSYLFVETPNFNFPHTRLPWSKAVHINYMQRMLINIRLTLQHAKQVNASVVFVTALGAHTGNNPYLVAAAYRAALSEPWFSNLGIKVVFTIDSSSSRGVGVDEQNIASQLAAPKPKTPTTSTINKVTLDIYQEVMQMPIEQILDLLSGASLGKKNDSVTWDCHPPLASQLQTASSPSPVTFFYKKHDEETRGQAVERLKADINQSPIHRVISACRQLMTMCGAPGLYIGFSDEACADLEKSCPRSNPRYTNDWKAFDTIFNKSKMATKKQSWSLPRLWSKRQSHNITTPENTEAAHIYEGDETSDAKALLQ